MHVIDADGHLNESAVTFSDKYLDPVFRSRRPRIVAIDGFYYWMIDEQLFPRRVGRGCNNFGTPASHEGKPTRHGSWIQDRHADSIESQELTDLSARLKAMDEEKISVQIVYPTLFLAYPLSSDPSFITALCSSYNRWLGDQLSGNERIKWAAAVNLDDIPGAVREVHEAKRLGAVAVMILGTAGHQTLDHLSLFPFYEAVVEEDLALAVHVGWAWPPLNNLVSDLYLSWVTAFLMPVLIGFGALMSGGVLDRFPNLRVVFLEAGGLWLHFMLDRLSHRFVHAKRLAQIYPQITLKAELSPMRYVQQGNLYFSIEIEDSLLPQVIDLVDEKQLVFGSDMPHGDRERFAARFLQERKDITLSAKLNILENNPSRLYKLHLPIKAAK